MKDINTSYSVSIWVGTQNHQDSLPPPPGVGMSEYPQFDAFIIPTKDVAAEGNVNRGAIVRVLTIYGGVTYYDQIDIPAKYAPFDEYPDIRCDQIDIGKTIDKMCNIIDCNIKQGG